MRRETKQVWIGSVLGAISALLLFAGTAHGFEGKLTEEFHQTYPLSNKGRIALENINGPVHISAWDRDEVKVDAVKSAWSKKRLDEARIEVNASANTISIRTKYTEHDQNFTSGDHDNSASVEYTLTVPRQARLDEISLVNGALDVQGVAGDVKASCVNGRLEARDLSGHVQLSTVNGQLDASVGQISSSHVELSAVNGGLKLTLPSDAKARVEASTVSGGISNDFGLPVAKHMVGRSLNGELGGGGTEIRLSNVNGRIEILHANDNRPMSPAKSIERSNRDDDKDDDDSI